MSPICISNPFIPNACYSGIRWSATPKFFFMKKSYSTSRSFNSTVPEAAEDFENATDFEVWKIIANWEMKTNHRFTMDLD
ncbi:hypothetical protein EAF04_000974 [Stromatinia cepivora]|nr:hypothetical protein EAF04_000974 [Stromatinia cepivora]